MSVKQSSLLIVGLAVILLSSPIAWGQTVIIRPAPDMPKIIRPPHPMPPFPHPRPRPRPPRGMYLEVKRHNVDVSIVDGVAVTAIDQVFHNPHKRTVEGTYVFPLDDNVGLSKFSMFVDGKEIEGQLLSVEEARRVYESIVAKMRDPALLEYVGKKMFRARIFPINADADVRVRLSYTQMLSIDNGLVYYRYPMNTKKYQSTPIETASVLVKIESKTPIKSVFSPSHKVGISRPSEHQASASFEGKSIIPDRDFELYYALSEKEFGMTVLTYRDGQAKDDGFFLARIAPPSNQVTTEILPKDICFVVDTSGSMAGEKMEQAVKALKFCIANLNTPDRFNIIPFSHEALRFKETLVPATTDNTQEARKFIDGLKAVGGTNINDALLAAMEAAPSGDSSRPYMIVFLTDGEATIGVTDRDEILENVAGKNAERVRLFVFGVGYDVNTLLLDLLAEQNNGARDYVQPGEDLELKLSSFYRKVSNPVLADLELTFHGLRVYDLYPPKLGDLFAGSELVVVGRYSGSGAHAVDLTGKRRGTQERFVYEAHFPTDNKSHDFLPRLWATRKVGFLLDEIRLHGEKKELKDTVVQLATRYGIVTPYTALLVTEPGQTPVARTFHREAFGRLGGLRSDDGRWFAGGMDFSGHPRARGLKAKKVAAVQRSLDASRAMGSFAFEVPMLAATEKWEGEYGGAPALTFVGNRTFYWVNDRWLDGDYDEDKTTRKVELYSQEYFELVRKHPELAKCFALGERVIVVLDGVQYETVSPREEPQP